MGNMGVVIRTWLSLTILSFALTAELNSVCITPSSSRGTCILLRQCSELQALMMRPRPLPAEVIQLLRRSQCGSQNREPLVCCRSTTTTSAVTTVLPPAARNVSTHRNIGLINPEFCGQTTVERIIGGNKTSILEFPWMALLSYQTEAGLQFKCGGTLINKLYVLTAAHCISFTNRLKLVSVRLGEHDTSTEEDCENSSEERVCAPHYQDIAVQEAFKHPSFDLRTIVNDIALIRLARPADLTKENVVPICLPTTLADQTNNLDGQQMLVAGWGVTENGVASYDLLKVFVPIVSHDQCKAMFKQKFGKTISESQLCAGGTNLMQDSCQGDSGGPLKRYGVVNSDSSMIQYGVVSYGHRHCGTEGVPAVYTRVGYYMDWILDTVRP